MNLNTKIMWWIVVLILSFHAVIGLGISPAKTTLFSEETTIYSGNFLVVNNDAEDMDVGISSQGQLAQYITLETTHLSLHKDGGIGTVYFTVKLPASSGSLPPGESLGAIVVQQERASSGTGGSDVGGSIGSQLVLYHKIIVQGPYPEKYVAAKLNFYESGQSIRLVSEVENLGTKPINEVKTTFYVNDKEQNPQVLETEKTSLQSKEDKLLDAHIERKSFERGEFGVLAVTEYDGQKTEVAKKLIVGRPEVDITYFDPYFIAHEVNPYSIDLLNKWNTLVENVFVDVDIKKDGQKIDSFRTKSIDIGAELSKRINDYFDAKDKSPGTYSFEMVVNFLNIYTMETKTFNSELLSRKETESREEVLANVNRSALAGEAAASSSGNPFPTMLLTIIPWLLLGLVLGAVLFYILWRYFHRNEYEGGKEREGML